MKCIYCHRPLKVEPLINNESYIYCINCNVSYITDPYQITVISIRIHDYQINIYPKNRNVNESYMVLDNWAEHSNYQAIMQFEELHWIFPSTAQQFVDKILKLLVFL